MSEEQIGRLLKALAGLERKVENLRKDVEEQWLSRILVLEDHVEQLRRRDSFHDRAIKTGEHEIEQTQKLLEAHAAELTATRRRVAIATAGAAAPGGAILYELLQILSQWLAGGG